MADRCTGGLLVVFSLRFKCAPAGRYNSSAVLIIARGDAYHLAVPGEGEEPF